jgi:hypothetical protein
VNLSVVAMKVVKIIDDKAGCHVCWTHSSQDISLKGQDEAKLMKDAFGQVILLYKDTGTTASVIFFAHKLQYADRTTLLVTRFAIVITRCVISEITPCQYRKPSVKCSYINNHCPGGLLQ